MTKEDITRMVEEASGGRQPDGWGVMLDHEQLERFVELVTAAERQRIHEYLMRLHMDAGGKHNYLHVAANGLEDL